MWCVRGRERNAALQREESLSQDAEWMSLEDVLSEVRPSPKGRSVRRPTYRRGCDSRTCGAGGRVLVAKGWAREGAGLPDRRTGLVRERVAFRRPFRRDVGTQHCGWHADTAHGLSPQHKTTSWSLTAGFVQ